MDIHPLSSPEHFQVDHTWRFLASSTRRRQSSVHQICMEVFHMRSRLQDQKNHGSLPHTRTIPYLLPSPHVQLAAVAFCCHRDTAWAASGVSNCEVSEGLRIENGIHFRNAKDWKQRELDKAATFQIEAYSSLVPTALTGRRTSYGSSWCATRNAELTVLFPATTTKMSVFKNPRAVTETLHWLLDTG